VKRVGIVSFFPAFQPAKSGGELRLSHIARRLAESFEVEMVAPTYGEAQYEEVRHHPRWVERRHPRSKAYHAGHRIADATGRFAECSGLVCTFAAQFHPSLRRDIAQMARSVDILTHESPFLQPLAPRRGRERQLLVYNSYNVEAHLAKAMFGKGFWGRMATRRVTALERALCREADVIFVCSDEDANGLVAEYGADRSKIVPAPNGVDIDTVRPATPEERAAARTHLGLREGEHACLFIGSFHTPNIEAVQLIADRLAPAHPDLTYLIAGKVCDAFRNRELPANVRLLGLVDDATRLALLRGVDIALNPMLSGSGTNLKMLEYLAAGLPIVTTPVGARGLGIEHRRHAVIAEEATMPGAISQALSDGALRAQLAREGRAHAAANFGWDVIADRVANVYELKTGRRVLVINDYPMTPADSGGRIRVNAVANQLADARLGVTVLTLTPEAVPQRLGLRPHLEELNIPKSPAHRRMDAVLSHWVGCSADDTSALVNTRRLTPAFAEAFRREARFADAVIFSHCYLEPFRRLVPRHARLVYDAHNVEFELKQKLYRDTMLARWFVRRVRRAEGTLARTAEVTFCVSEATAEALRRMAPQRAADIHVAPNGVDCARARVLDRPTRLRLRTAAGLGEEPTAIFLGSGHPPNAEAARHIVDRYAGELPHVCFLIVGSVCGWFHGRPLPDNVVMMKTVPAEVKDFLLSVSDFALNPMETGSGTSLKLFDYLAAGCPVITTRMGARGIPPEKEGILYLADVAEFPRVIREVASAPDALEERRAGSRRIAEDYFDWPVALAPMLASLRQVRA
jgi:glycosyltransferase involved in cell wall biosynthesis